jgi:hypothetical protein
VTGDGENDDEDETIYIRTISGAVEKKQANAEMAKYVPKP